MSQLAPSLPAFSSRSSVTSRHSAAGAGPDGSTNDRKASAAKTNLTSKLIPFSAVTFTVVIRQATTHEGHDRLDGFESAWPGGSPPSDPGAGMLVPSGDSCQRRLRSVRRGRRENECVQSRPLGHPELYGDQHPHRDRPRFIARRFEAPLTDGVGGRSIELGMARGLLHGER